MAIRWLVFLPRDAL